MADKLPSESLNIDIRSGTRRSALITGGIVAVGLAALAVVVIGNAPAGDEPPIDATPIDAEFNHGKHKTAIKILRIELEREPCSRRKARDLSQKLNNAGDYRATIEVVSRFHETCDRYSRLLWNRVYAHEQIEQYAEAIPLITSLIEERPEDEDFWWWRGQDHAKLDQVDLADADYRQSLAIEPNKFTARRYPRLMKDITPCEVAWSLQYMIDKRPSHVASWMRDTLSETYLAGDCDKLRGKGQTRIAIEATSPLIDTEATINGKTGAFTVQENTAFLLLSKALADSADVSVTNVAIPVYVAGSFLTGKRAIVDTATVGKASANRVVAVVVDKLPGERDGVIGLSFLWRFKTEKTADNLLLSQR